MSHVDTTDGTRLYYEEHGEGETILLVHGWTMNSEYWWRENTAALAEGHHVVTYDHRGHGRSEKPEGGHTLERYASDLRDLVEALGLDDVTLVGWSMGAAVALTYLDRFGSDRVRSLALVDQSPMFFSEDDWDYPLFGEFSPEALDGVVAGLETDREGTVKPVLATFFAEPPGSETIDEMYAETTRTPTGTATAVLADMATTDLRDVVAAVDVPTLLCYGEQSAVFPGDVGGWLESRMPDATLVRFEGSGHCPHWEEPATFNAELAAFVERTGARDRPLAGPK
ncbi:alpha/beta fold hydrolase [Halomarina ordinaria]|uniref:Alpha/beta fold hydrolase n=1 Tax=Halomarina ordinaria TaxID=3033939 RepID=A0ABD5U9V4_9EURY|nr:alpha/beta hydrolase [Halomarina sp. PSRA2]